MAERSSTQVAPSDPSSVSTGELVGRLSEQTTTLIRDEIRLAQVELQQKAKQAGLGAGLLGAAGVVGLYALGVVIATAIAALALVVDVWLAGLIVAGVLVVVAGVLALVGKKRVARATPLAPQQAIDGVKKDLAAVKEARS